MTGENVDYHFEDFTEAEYRELLCLVKANWELISFADYRKPGKVCLWRHDIDFSVHRAYRLAQIEAEEGIRTTYFIDLHSKFYNAFEDEIAERIAGIQALGHILGLHFDPQFYSASLNSRPEVLRYLRVERRIMRHIFKTEPYAFSIHDPDSVRWLDFNKDEIGGMINVYGQYIRNNYSYCSDSNGYWRFRRLRDVLEDASDEKLHVLTHPEMWTQEPMSPRQRITRCIEGRAARQHQWYNDILAKSGRENVH